MFRKSANAPIYVLGQAEPRSFTTIAYSWLALVAVILLAVVLAPKAIPVASRMMDPLGTRGVSWLAGAMALLVVVWFAFRLLRWCWRVGCEAYQRGVQIEAGLKVAAWVS